MRKGVRLVRLLSWSDIYNDLMSRPNIEPDWGGWLVECGGTLKREIFCPMTPDILWMNQSLVTIWWAVQDTPYRVTQPPACPEWKLVCPASPAQSRQSWVTFVFSRRPWKVLAAQAGLGLAGYIMATWSNKNRRKGDDYDFPLTFH